jgi:hypothetical protein
MLPHEQRYKGFHFTLITVASAVIAKRARTTSIFRWDMIAIVSLSLATTTGLPVACIDFVFVDQQQVLKLAFLSKRGPNTERIAKRYGLRWSVLNELPGWTPHGSAPFDPMHNLYSGMFLFSESAHDTYSCTSGIVKSLWGDVIEDGFLLSHEQKSEFKEFMDGLEWPSQAGRLPVSI